MLSSLSAKMMGLGVLLADQLRFVEGVYLNEVVVRGRVQRLVVVYKSLLHVALRSECVLVLAGVVGEDIKYPLFDQNSVVGPCSWDPPLVRVLLWVVLSGEEWVVLGFESRYELLTHWTDARRYQSPEVAQRN